MANKKKRNASSRLSSTLRAKAGGQMVDGLQRATTGGLIAAGGAVALGPVGATVGGLIGAAKLYSGGYKIIKGYRTAVTAEMIERQGMNVAQSHRMAETLSMASLATGVTGPQSVGSPKKQRRRKPLKSTSSKKSSSTKVSTAKSGAPSNTSKKSGNKKRGTQNLANRKAIAKSKAYRRK